jgi:mono/diheme cytochrome c family protein
MRAIGVAVALCVWTAAGVAAQDAKLAKGAEVYAAQKCGLCHSVGEKGNKKGPLDGVGSRLQADEIRLWMTDAKAMTAKTNSTRKPDMKSYSLPKEDLDALVAYMVSLKK